MIEKITELPLLLKMCKVNIFSLSLSPPLSPTHKTLIKRFSLNLISNIFIGIQTQKFKFPCAKQTSTTIYVQINLYIQFIILRGEHTVD
jgi:hypothetical protein